MSRRILTSKGKRLTIGRNTEKISGELDAAQLPRRGVLQRGVACGRNEGNKESLRDSAMEIE